jgi:polyisoprenoid-binding protein YceI
MQTKPDHAPTTLTAPTTPTTPTTPWLGRYEIDTSCSTVTFRTRHLFGLAPVRGAFAIQSGTIDVAEPLADSSIHVQIETASFRTGNSQRDSNVRSARLLDAVQHPVMTFRSEGIDGRALTGTLTVGGVTRPVSLSVEHLASSPQLLTAQATTRIDRTDFGVTAYRGLAGRYLDVSVEVRCVRK